MYTYNTHRNTPEPTPQTVVEPSAYINICVHIDIYIHTTHIERHLGPRHRQS